MFNAPGNVLGYVSDKATDSSLTRPVEHRKVPVINPTAAIVIASNEPVPQVIQEELAKQQVEPIWPIHGAITTQFGVPHWPYQPTHTGLDISSGRSSGATAVTAFKPGIVVEAVRSNYSLGNRVVVDHGDGLTSVYGHLYSISVHAGQEVGTSSILGFEGSTGASTGTHLHFEIRVNGQSVNPKPYIKSAL
jgi:murein DD-endopeptidase MepM/ murein hydrolase activator NlpD